LSFQASFVEAGYEGRACTFILKQWQVWLGSQRIPTCRNGYRRKDDEDRNGAKPRRDDVAKFEGTRDDTADKV
jgi:hypothetical protein